MFALTIDYEIAGDGKGSFYDDMIYPTDRLLNLLEKYNFTIGTLFESFK